MPTLCTQVAQIREIMKETGRDVEVLKNKADALLRQTFQLAEFIIPRLFIVVPDETSKLDLHNLVQRSYRLFFFCEHEKEPHLAFHEGYELDQPRQFIQKYAPYFKNMLTIVKYAVTASSILVPQLGQLAPQLHVPNCLRDHKFWDNSNQKLECMNNVLGKVSDDDEQISLPDINLEGADLRQIESFLKKKDLHRTLGNLYRSTQDDGSV